MVSPQIPEIEDASPPRGLWIRQLSGPERSAFIATFGGWMLDGMDVMVYSLVLPTLLAEWHISKGQAGLLSTVTLLLSSLGGWLAGILADRVGRVRVLKLTIFWFAFFTFLSGFTQNFEQLLVVRGLQGLGFGGEWAVGAALMGESIRTRFRGRAVGIVQAGWSIGWGLSVILFTILFSRLPHAIAWRVMFWIGILPALLIVYIRGKVEEPEIYLQRKQGASLAGIFSSGYLRTTLLAALLALGAQGGYHAVTTWLPLYLRSSRGLSTLNTGAYLFVIILGAFSGYVTRCLPDRRDWTKADPDIVCRLLLFCGDLLLRLSHLEPSDARARFPPGLLPVRIVQPHGRLLQRAFSYIPARLRRGFCLQFRPRSRRFVSHACRLRKRPYFAWGSDLYLWIRRISGDDPRCYVSA